MSKKIRRAVKDSVFTTLFGETKYTLDLYRSLHPEDTTTTEDDIKIITIKNILVTGMFNDLSFLIGQKLMIFAEAQSTFSVKLAIRLFLYYAESLREYISDMEIDLYSDSDILGYRTKRIVDNKVIKSDPIFSLPTPEFYVIYTGDKKDVPDTIDFADLYLPSSDGTKKVNLSVKIIRSSSREGDYVSQYFRFCKAANEMRKTYSHDLNLAVKKLTEYCLLNNILADFVKKHENEVFTMMDILFNQEYVTEIHEKNLVWESYNNGYDDGVTKGEEKGRSEGRAEGMAEGRAEGRTEGENKLSTLFKALEKAGRKDDAFKAASDTEYRQKLYEEFGIE